MKENNNDKRSISEKVDDEIEEVMGTIEDLTMGQKKDFQNDIPATMYDGNGRRRVNRVQTRKNISKRVLGKHGLKILFIIIVIGCVISLGYYLISLLLMN